MNPESYENLKRYVRFTAEHGERVRALAEAAKRVFPRVIDSFYAHLLSNERARHVFTGGDEQIEQQRRVFGIWLEGVFEGEYGPEYLAKRREIGRTHVRAGLPQHFMFSAMEIVWRELSNGLIESQGPAVVPNLEALHTLLMLDLAIMLESYQESYAEQVRANERSAVEEKLTRAEHLAEIGQLAASLAHEIKNPLAGISGAIQIIQDSMKETDPHRQIISEVIGQIHRLDATVKDLLLYARPIPPRASSFPLANVVARVLSVLREEPAMQALDVRFSPGPDGAALRADEAQIEHLLINLILNAAQASKARAVVHVQIEEAGPDRLRIVVSDEGIGMPGDVRDRAFEAFYTTKAKGTGLGLSICRKIVDAHEGTIHLDSEPGRGTTVTIELPKHRGDPGGSD